MSNLVEYLTEHMDPEDFKSFMEDCLEDEDVLTDMYDLLTLETYTNCEKRIYEARIKLQNSCEKVLKRKF